MAIWERRKVSRVRGWTRRRKSCDPCLRHLAPRLFRDKGVLDGLPGRSCLPDKLTFSLPYHNSSPRGTTTGANSAHVILGSSYRYGLLGGGAALRARSLTTLDIHGEGIGTSWRGALLGGGVLGGRCGVLQVYWMRIYMILEGAAWRFPAERVGSDWTARLRGLPHGGEQKQTQQTLVP